MVVNKCGMKNQTKLSISLKKHLLKISPLSINSIKATTFFHDSSLLYCFVSFVKTHLTHVDRFIILRHYTNISFHLINSPQYNTVLSIS